MPHYAFIVGVNQDWPEQRCSLGDIGLARRLKSLCRSRRPPLPPEKYVAEVYDERATRSNVLRALEGLLDRRNDERSASRRRRDGDVRGGGGGGGAEEEEEEDTLVFYYGGHGKRTAFCTQRETAEDGKIVREPWLEYSEIVDLLERKFEGGTAVCVIDCCHSGGFGEAVVRRREDARGLKAKYGCIMSVPPADQAGLEWSLSECFIRAFGGELRSHPRGEDCRPYYLSTKDGVHPVDKSKPSEPDSAGSLDIIETKGNAHHPTWGQVIEYLADEMARIKGDRLTTLLRGEGMEDGTFLARPCVFESATDDVSTSRTSRIPRDDSWMDPFLRDRHSVGDWVYVRSAVGGASAADRPTGWFPGRVISVGPSVCDGSATMATDGRGGDAPSGPTAVRVELYDDISGARWTVALPLDAPPPSGRNAMLGGLPFSYGFGFDPQPCIDVVARMARKLAYIDTTLPSNARVRAPWPEDGRRYEATTLCRRAIPWERVDPESSRGAVGPCVPLRWKDDGGVSFVPTAACVTRDGSKQVTLAEKSAVVPLGRISTPMEAMMASFACGGKKLNGDSPILGGAVAEEDENFWEAYDPEDFKWSRVRLMNSVDPSNLPLRVLAYHMCYREAGKYSLVYWESDSTISLVPNGYLRPRRRSIENGSDGGEDEGSGDTAEEDEVRRYVDEACRGLDESSKGNPAGLARERRLELASLALVCFGLGFVLGSRSKRC